MRRFVTCFGLAAIAIIVFTCAPKANSQTLRYTVSTDVTGILWGTAPTNCATNPCLITITAVGNASTAVSFGYTCITAPCDVIGEGSDGYWNTSLTNLTVTVYDPIAGVTYGPAAFPPGFFTAFDNFNGGIGFGSLGYGGPAYPVSVAVNAGGFAYSPNGIFVFYGLTYPVLVGGLLLNCPTQGTTPPCATTSPLPIPVTLADGTVVNLSVPTTSNYFVSAQYWVQEEPAFHQWTAAASMTEARYGHTATLLSSGQVLVVGGPAGTAAATTPEIYDPIANSWASTSAPSCGRTGHTATLLAGGRVLVVGGAQCPTTAEVFDPVAGLWSTVAPIPVSFPGPATAVRLQDNRVLVAGANGGEIYDPVLNAWSAVPPPPIPFVNPVGALLQNGSVVLLDYTCLQAQIFAPASATWTAGPPCTLASDANLTATTLNTGDVLVYGLTAGNGDLPDGFWSLYQPATNMWGGTQPPEPTFNTYDLNTLPIGANAVAQTLLDGRVLLVGGDARGDQPTVAHPTPTVPLPAPISPLFYPTGFPALNQSYGLWLPEPALTTGRTGHAVVTLQNGDVLAIGGLSIGSAPSALSSVERLNMGTLPPAAAPIFSLPSGAYNNSDYLYFYKNDPTETFYYTYSPNGTVPTASSTLYGVPIPISMPGVVEAIGIAPYHAPSPITSATYTIGATPTLSINCTPNPVGYQQQLTCSSTVSGDHGGTIAFTINGNAWTSGAPNGSGTFSASRTVGVSSGTYTVTAKYSGDTIYAPASASVAVTAQPATPTLSINCTPNPVGYQQQLTCSSTVSGDHGGTIAFTISGNLWTSGAPNGSGTFSATRTVQGTSGTYTVTATYSGDTNYAPASASVAVTIQPTPTLSINCTPNPVGYHQQLTCSSTVSGDHGGTIAFTIDGNPWTSGAPSGSGTFSATRTVQGSSGTYTVTATYSGDTNYAPASASVAVTIQPTPTLSINCTPNPVSIHQQLTCSSTVSGDSGGMIAFTIDGSPWTSGAPNGSGTFSAIRTVQVSSGTYTVTANYSGDANYAPTSASVVVTAQP